MHVTGIRGDEKEEGAEEMFAAIMTDNLPQINIRHRSTDPGSSDNTKQNECQRKIPQLMSTCISSRHIYVI